MVMQGGMTRACIRGCDAGSVTSSYRDPPVLAGRAKRDMRRDAFKVLAASPVICSLCIPDQLAQLCFCERG